MILLKIQKVIDLIFMNMLRKVLFTLVIVLLTGSITYGQNATIKGKVTETDGKTPIEFANVQLMQEGVLILGAVTDEDGQYTLKPIQSGKYDLIVSCMGYAKFTLEGLEVRGSQTKIQPVTLSSSAITKGEVKVVAERPLFQQDQTVTEDRVSADEMKNMAGKSVSSVLSTMSGVTVGSGGSMNVRGNRDGQTAYYVDGVKTSSVPQGAIGEMALLMGALPAKYGDATSVVEIETKGISREYHGSVDVYGSIDGYNDFGLRFDVAGPLALKKDGTPLVGFLLSGEASYSTGGAVRGGTYRASQETIDYLIANPLRGVEGSSSAAVAMNTNYITFYEENNILSLQEKKGRRLQNAWSYGGMLAAKLDIRTSKNIDLMFSGNVSYSKGRSFNFSNTLFNSANNGMSQSISWNANARFTQRFESAEKSKIQNAFYRLQAYYVQSRSHSYSHIHKDNLFDYGYVGKYEHTMSKYYDTATVELEDGTSIFTNALSTYYISNVDFTPGTQNAALAQYTLGAYERANGRMVNDEYIQTYKGLLNGEFPDQSSYGLFTAPGLPYNGNGRSSSDRIGAKAMVSFDIKGREGKDHNIEFGFEYIQTTSRSWSISPVGLWTLMRDQTNSHIQELDKEHPIFYEDEYGNMIDTVDYNRYVSVEAQTTFDKSIRTKLGAADNEWIDIDAYDPSMYSLDMFSAEELFHNGNNIVSFYGYDYTGKHMTNKGITMASLQDWFNEGDPSSKRDFSVIGASKPIRMAAYIQDKFAIKSLYFSLGLRLDIFDNNQPYVKDMFLYREAYTVKEAQAAGFISSETYIPDFMNNSDNYYIYVQDATATSDVEITAFRSGLTWYDAQGNEVTDAATLASAAGQTNLMPLLKETPGPSDVSKVNYKAFADYTPTFKNGGITLSPRISFSFVVGESSVFSASYNIVTNTASQRFNPLSYLYFEKYAGSSSTFSNPGLKPERSVDYEVGFQQGISKNLKVEFKAYYSEKRDQIVVYHYNQAYPVSYYSYTNMDFGTVQGFLLGLTMRKVKNISFRASYTIQFAKGTGSDATSTLALIRSGQPNLRTLTVLDYDQRHKIQLNLEYSFGFGPQYNGPKTTKATKDGSRSVEIKWLQGAGVSLNLGVGSGLPYTRSSVAYSTIVGQGSRSVEGAINGSRMPWVVDCNLQVWKDFIFNLRKADDVKKAKPGYLRVYVAMMNLFGLKKIRSVYSYTGSPIDDGFLTASDYQKYIASQENVQSFIDYYTIRMQGANAYGSPMTAELGVQFSF